jgi:hypothetical protein
MSNGQTHGGKGSTARPTDKKKYEDNYDRIFDKKTREKEELYKAVNEVLKEAKLKDMK